MNPPDSEPIIEQRRHPRSQNFIPVTLRTAQGVIKGETVNESYTGILVKIHEGELPTVGEECQVVLEIMGEKVDAIGDVIRVVEKERQCGVDLKQLGPNGILLLAIFPADYMEE